MATSLDPDIINAFDYYRKSLFTISNDLHFWDLSLDNMIKEYQKNPEFVNQYAFQSIFCVYNLPSKPSENCLKVYQAPFLVKTEELIEYKQSFFLWTRNSSILKAYNSCELLLLRSIQLKYFPTLTDPRKDRKSARKVDNEIRNTFTKPDVNNNRHVIEFLKLKIPEFESFSKDLVRIDRATTWGNFFELFSILRNTIAHNNSILSDDAYNQIKSVSKDIFEYHFELQLDENNFKLLIPKSGDSFSNFINLINDFSLNTSKFIFGESDLRFLDMH